jgi:hypothetical protein
MRQVSLFNTSRHPPDALPDHPRRPTAGQDPLADGLTLAPGDHYRYAPMHFDLDSHDTYPATDDDPTRTVPDPAKKLAYSGIDKTSGQCIRPKPPVTVNCWPRLTPLPGTTTVLTNTTINTINTDVHTQVRTTLTGSGDIIPDTATNTLHIRLDPLSAPRHTAAIDELCQALNDAHPIYPAPTSPCTTAPNPTVDPATIPTL